jgi:hypothetical protein
VFVIMVLLERDDGARTHSTVARQMTHVTPGARCFFNRTGLTTRGQGMIADGRGDSSLRQQNEQSDKNYERTSRTFSGQLPAPTSRDSTAT